MTDLSDMPCREGMGPFLIVGDSAIGAGAMIAGAHRGLLGSEDIGDMERALAYSAARTDIEMYCKFRLRDETGNWFDTTDIDPDDAEHVNLAVKYLSALKLLRRHPDHPEWIAIAELTEAAR